MHNAVDIQAFRQYEYQSTLIYSAVNIAYTIYNVIRYQKWCILVLDYLWPIVIATGHESRSGWDPQKLLDPFILTGSIIV